MVRPEPLTKRFWALIIIGGLLLMALVGGLTFASLYKQTSERANSTVEYIKRQSLECELVNNANVMKSQVRVMQNASQVARNIDADKGDLSKRRLQQYASDLHLTSIFVLDPKGDVVAQCQGTGDKLDDIKPLLADNAVLNVAENPKKIYATRLFFDDDSYADFACAKRIDAPGIVIALYHTEPEYANRFLLTLQNLLEGYRIANDTSVLVEKDGEVVASSIIDSGTSAEATATDAKEIANDIKQHCDPGQLHLVKGEHAYYYGVYGKARNYYVYTFSKASRLLHYMASNAVAAAAVYAVIVFIFMANRRRLEHEHLTTLLDQQQQYSAQLEEAVKVAQDASAAKTEFLQRMSHDLRTPLNGILGMVEMGDTCPEDQEKQAECRKKVRMASGILLDLVNETLDLSKFDSKEIVLDLEAVELDRIINDAYDMVERQAALRDIHVRKERLAIEHPYVMANALYLRRLLMNIASNAVKYNKDGGDVVISYREASFADGIATYQITVKDTGIGMSEEFQEKLFEPFSREEQELEHKPNGTGLGMVMAKQLAELMGGSITCESELGVGTTCTITIPFEVANKSGAVTCVHAGSESEPLKGLKVLMAEDNELNREIAEFIITRAGATIETATDGKAAVELFAASPLRTFDVVLMDIMMPTMNGYEAARAIRALPREDAVLVPIIAISANAFADDRAKSHEAGMNAHVAKPLNADELIATINTLIEK